MDESVEPLSRTSSGLSNSCPEDDVQILSGYFFCFCCDSNLESEDKFASHLDSIQHLRNLEKRKLISERAYKALLATFDLEESQDVTNEIPELCNDLDSVQLASTNPESWVMKGSDKFQTSPNSVFLLNVESTAVNIQKMLLENLESLMSHASPSSPGRRTRRSRRQRKHRRSTLVPPFSCNNCGHQFDAATTKETYEKHLEECIPQHEESIELVTEGTQTELETSTDEVSSSSAAPLQKAVGKHLNCEDCAVECVTEANMEQHLRGKKHLTNVSDELLCATCDVRCVSKPSFDQHISGQKHLNRLKVVSATPTAVSATSAEVNGSGTSEAMPKANVEDRLHCSEPAKVTSEVFSCLTCGVEVPGSTGLKQHHRGKLHKANMLESTTEIYICLLCNFEVNGYHEIYRHSFTSPEHKEKVKARNPSKKKKKRNVKAAESSKSECSESEWSECSAGGIYAKPQRSCGKYFCECGMSIVQPGPLFPHKTGKTHARRLVSEYFDSMGCCLCCGEAVPGKGSIQQIQHVQLHEAMLLD